MSASSSSSLPGLGQHLAGIVGDLIRMAAARWVKNYAVTPLLLLLYARLNRMVARFASLAARAEAGTLPPPRASRPRPARKPGPPRQRLPEGFGWLVQMLRETLVFGSQLQALLSRPEMAALLEATPQAARLLRPLCRMLAVPPSALPPPPGKPAVRTHREAPAEPASHAPPPGPTPPDTPGILKAE